MKSPLERLKEEILSWPHISVHPHRFGGREFRFGKAEVGHVHLGGIVDIPFPRSIRDALLDEGLAEEHQWVPDSGWVTFRLRSEEDLKHAIWLMRLFWRHIRHSAPSAARNCRMAVGYNLRRRDRACLYFPFLGDFRKSEIENFGVAIFRQEDIR